MDYQKPRTPPDQAHEGPKASKLSENPNNLLGLFNHTIIRPILEFIRKPVIILYSLGYFLFLPVQFAKAYHKLYMEKTNQDTAESNSLRKTLQILDQKSLAASFAWTWLSISAIGLFFGGFNMAIAVTKWPVLSSLLTGLTYQILYFVALAIIWALIKIAAGSRVSSEQATFHAAYYAFTLLFPAMVLTLIFMVVKKIGVDVLWFLNEIEPRPGTAYPGAWGQYTAAVVGVIFAAIFVIDEFKYYILAFYATVLYITFIHPSTVLKRVYHVPFWRSSLVYFGSLLTYLVVTVLLSQVTDYAMLALIGLLPLVVLFPI